MTTIRRFIAAVMILFGAVKDLLPFRHRFLLWKRRKESKCPDCQHPEFYHGLDMEGWRFCKMCSCGLHKSAMAPCFSCQHNTELHHWSAEDSMIVCQMCPCRVFMGG